MTPAIAIQPMLEAQTASAAAQAFASLNLTPDVVDAMAPYFDGLHRAIAEVDRRSAEAFAKARRSLALNVRDPDPAVDPKEIQAHLAKLLSGQKDWPRIRHAWVTQVRPFLSRDEVVAEARRLFKKTGPKPKTKKKDAAVTAIQRAQKLNEIAPQVVLAQGDLSLLEFWTQMNFRIPEDLRLNAWDLLVQIRTFREARSLCCGEWVQKYLRHPLWLLADALEKAEEVAPEQGKEPKLVALELLGLPHENEELFFRIFQRWAYHMTAPAALGRELRRKWFRPLISQDRLESLLQKGEAVLRGADAKKESLSPLTFWSRVYERFPSIDGEKAPSILGLERIVREGIAIYRIPKTRFERVEEYLVGNFSLFEEAFNQVNSEDSKGILEKVTVRTMALLKGVESRSEFDRWFSLFRVDPTIDKNRLGILEEEIRRRIRGGKPAFSHDHIIRVARSIAAQLKAEAEEEEKPLADQNEYLKRVALALGMEVLSMKHRIMTRRSRGGDTKDWDEMLKAFPAPVRTTPVGTSPAHQKAYQKALDAFKAADALRTEQGGTGWAAYLGKATEKFLTESSSLKAYLSHLKRLGHHIEPILEILRRWRVPEHMYLRGRENSPRTRSKGPSRLFARAK